MIIGTVAILCLCKFGFMVFLIAFVGPLVRLFECGAQMCVCVCVCLFTIILVQFFG